MVTVTPVVSFSAGAVNFQVSFILPTKDKYDKKTLLGADFFCKMVCGRGGNLYLFQVEGHISDLGRSD